MSKTILITDQDQLTHDLLNQIIDLKLDDVNAIHSYNAQECLNLTKTIIPSIILISLDIQDIDYIDVIDQISNSPNAAKISLVALVNDDWYFRRSKLRKQGFKDYIRKPISSDEVERIINSCLQNT